MSLVTHYKSPLRCLKLNHHQASHGSCQAAHLPYISLVGGRASASQDGNLCLHRTAVLHVCRECGTPGSEEFNVCAQQQNIRLAAHTDWAQQQLESKDSKWLHSTKELHQAITQSSSLGYAKQNTHTLKFILMSLRLKSSYFRLQHTGPEQSREGGMDCWVRHAQNENGTRHYRHFIYK